MKCVPVLVNTYKIQEENEQRTRGAETARKEDGIQE